MNEQVIIAVANAITAQAETLKALIEALPKETKAAVEKRVTKATTAQAPSAIVESDAKPVVAAPAVPVVETTTAPVVNAITPAPVAIQQPVQQAMPAAPFPTVAAPAPTPAAPAPAPVVSAPVAPATASPSNVPFNDHKSMLQWVMNAYQSVPREVGARIQEVLNSLGTHNINDVKPEQYASLFSGVNNVLGK